MTDAHDDLEARMAELLGDTAAAAPAAPAAVTPTPQVEAPKRPADPNPRAGWFEAINQATAHFVGAVTVTETNDRIAMHEAVAWVDRVVDDGTLEGRHGPDVLTVHSFRSPSDLLVQTALREAVEEAPNRVGQTSSQTAAATAALVHGFVMAVGSPDVEEFKADRRASFADPQLRFLLAGVTGLAAAAAVPAVLGATYSNAWFVGSVQRDIAATLFRPRPATVCAAATAVVIAKLLQLRGAPGRGPGEAGFDDEVKRWVRDGSGSAALDRALERVVDHRGLSGARRAAAVKDVRAALLAGIKGYEPGWYTGEASGQKDIQNAKDHAVQAVARVNVVLNRHTPGAALL